MENEQNAPEKRYIGEKAIADVKEAGDNSIITYEDGTIQEMRTKLFNASVSPEPLDASALRFLQMQPVAGDMLLVLFDWNIKWSDYDFVDSIVRASLQEHMKAADGKLWGKPKDDITIQDIDKVKRQ